MNRRALLSGGLAVAGSAAVLIGIHQELLHFRPAYGGTVRTGWGGPLNHEERLLARLGALGVLGAVATVRRRHAAVVPGAVGGVVLFYALRAVVHHVRESGLFTGIPVHGGTTGRFVLGAEPYWLVAGGVLFVLAGVVGRHAARSGDADALRAPSL